MPIIREDKTRIQGHRQRFQVCRDFYGCLYYLSNCHPDHPETVVVQQQLEEGLEFDSEKCRFFCVPRDFDVSAFDWIDIDDPLHDGTDMRQDERGKVVIRDEPDEIQFGNVLVRAELVDDEPDVVYEAEVVPERPPVDREAIYREILAECPKRRALRYAAAKAVAADLARAYYHARGVDPDTVDPRKMRARANSLYPSALREVQEYAD